MRIEENRELAPLTTLGIGGAARWFADAATEAEVQEAACWARETHVPLFVLGGGSNLLVADRGFHGLVLRIALKGIEPRQGGSDPDTRIYGVAAGEDWDAFVSRAVNDGCAGVECLAGIPGSAGGTPVQNVGAYGQEVSSTIIRVRVFDRFDSVFKQISRADAGFAYRRSRFNGEDNGRYIVTEIEYGLRAGAKPALRYADLQRAFPEDSNPGLKEVADTVRRIRRSKGMLLVDGDPDCRSAGSFFKNPSVTREHADRIAEVAGGQPPRFPTAPGPEGEVKLPAAWLIEKAGFTRGYSLGRAAISSRHTLALVNLGGATAMDMITLAEKIRAAVLNRFAVRLDMEPVMLGFE